MKIENLINTNSKRIEAEIIIANILGKDRSYLHAHKEDVLTTTHLTEFKQKMFRLSSNEPLAYILGFKEFYGLNFLVDKRVLIPRPETEELVNKVLNTKLGVEPIKNVGDTVIIADVGTGSGCIAISLAKNIPNARIFAIDTDVSALVLAKKNASLNKVGGKITFLNGDLLSPLKEKVDVIVANLPYIKSDSLDNLDERISHWEPKIALDGGRDGWKIYNQLFSQTDKYLRKNGKVFYEFDGNIFSSKLPS